MGETNPIFRRWFVSLEAAKDEYAMAESGRIRYEYR